MPQRSNRRRAVGPPDAEWQIWAKRFIDEHTLLKNEHIELKDEYMTLLNRVKALEEDCMTLRASHTKSSAVTDSSNVMLSDASEADTQTGALSIDEHLKVSTSILADEERRHVMEFVRKLPGERERATLEAVLEANGWNWVVASTTLRQMSKDNDERRKRRRALLEPWL